MKIPGFARYGTVEIILTGIFAAVIAILLVVVGLPWLVIVPLLLYGWVLWFFRDPPRTAPDNPKAVVSPADGTITHIEERPAPEFMDGPCLMIGIFLSIFNVHINRMPFKGMVKYIKYTPGAFHDARDEKAFTENEANEIGIETEHPQADKMLVKQISGLLARCIVCDCNEGDNCAAGQIVGMIKFGSRTELYLPLKADFTTQVKVGDKVEAGSTILGELS